MWTFVVTGETLVEALGPGRRVTLDLAGAPVRAEAMAGDPARSTLGRFLLQQPSLDRLDWPLIEEVLATGGVDVPTLRWRHPAARA